MASLAPIYTQTAKQISLQHFSNLEKGLEETVAAKRLAEFGRNIIKEKKSVSPVVIFLSQFKGPFVILLFVAAAMSFYFKEWLDGSAILVVIIVNAIIGFVMEYQAERSMEALKKLTKMNGKVVRNGELKEIPSDEIVPGDILFVEAGDMVLADARIFSSSQFQVDESALTGESLPVEKVEKTLDENTPLAERVNMIFKGTFVSKGNSRAIVSSTGMQTEFGKIAAMLQSAGETATPLEKKIEQFSKKLIWVTVLLVIIVFLAGVLEGDNIFDLLQTSIALAVAAIPEGLPIVATLALAQGMLKMARHKVIVKKLSAVETLGGTKVICTDKTGTLTQNKIEVSTVVTPESSFEIKIDFAHRNSTSEEENFQKVKKIAVLCNTAELIFRKGDIKEVGDPLETGLLKFAYSEGVELEQFREQNIKVSEVPFSSETRIMATQHQSSQGKYFVAAKGAVEEILKRCNAFYLNGETKLLDEAFRSEWIKRADELAQSGLRVIATAFKEETTRTGELTRDLVFAGLVGMLDPPREDVYAAIQECKSAGINIKMITGDHPATAKNIAIKLGLSDSERDEAIHGSKMRDFEVLTADEKQKWTDSKIFARVSPKQKLDLVSVLQEKHFVVGMTGDGVNDAPALKKADIGIAMGLRGTQVAQETADMILKDDSFSSIVLAIKQGRVIFENIRKFVIYLLSCNLSELLVISFSSVLNLHYALFPLQILYINLVTDVLPALALGVTEGGDSIMKRPPKNPDEPIVDKKRWKSIIGYSVIIAASALGAVFFTHYTVHRTEHWNPVLCNNVLFITLILSQLLHVFNVTSDKKVAFYKSDVFRNKYVWYALGVCIALTLGVYLIEPVAKVLSLSKPSFIDLGIMLGFSLLSLLVIQILKRWNII